MIAIVDIVHKIARSLPTLETELRVARIKQRPEEFVKKTLSAAMLFSFGLSFFIFMILTSLRKPVFVAFPAFFVFFPIFFFFLLKRPIVMIKKRERELDREVLFAGRFLLVKINSGRPLINALYDASESYGVSSKYFKEIVDDITMGTPIEKAIDNVIKYTPSAKFRKIMFQINNSIKIGTDVSRPLSSALDEISKEQLINIQRYSKKLSSLSLFYMLLAVILPSLGMAMFVVVGSMLGIFAGGVTTSIFTVVIISLVIVQLIFISMFKGSRVSVNL